MREEMKANYKEALRLMKWEINLISSGLSTNREYGFGEIDKSAQFKGKKRPKKAPGSRYASVYSMESLHAKKKSLEPLEQIWNIYTLISSFYSDRKKNSSNNELQTANEIFIFKIKSLLI